MRTVKASDDRQPGAELTGRRSEPCAGVKARPGRLAAAMRPFGRHGSETDARERGPQTGLAFGVTPARNDIAACLAHAAAQLRVGE